MAAGWVANSAYGVSFSIKNMDSNSNIISHSRTDTGGAQWSSTFTLQQDTNVRISTYNYNGTIGSAIIRIE